MTLRVLLVDDDAGRSAILRSALHRAGYRVVAEVRATIALGRIVKRTRPDVIVIDRDSPDRDILEHVCLVTREDPRPIVMFTQDRDRSRMREALRAGVSAYVVDGLAAERVQPIVDLALARFEQCRALREELERTKATLAERKRIERAKGIVMKQRGCDEAEAYATLRRLAMERHRRLAQVADEVIALAELFI